MRIAIDGSPLLEPNPTGVGRVVREVVRELASRETSHEFLVVAPDREAPIELPAAPRSAVRSVAIPARGKRWRGRPAEEFVKAEKIDVFWSTVSAFPRGAGCATVATVHEVPWEVPGTRGDEGTGLDHRLWATLDAWFATRIVCPSRATADAFLRSNLRKGSKGKLTVVPWGVGARFAPKAPEGEAHDVEKWKIRPDYPFFLVVAAPRRIKNFDLALRALRIVRDRSNVDARLLIAGPAGVELHRALGYADGLGLRQYVTPLSFVPDRELAELYRRARATLVLSRSEGFGFPVLESMACGTPVIHSGAGSLAEVAGDAGIQVPLDDEEAVARAMTSMHADETKRKERVEKGLAHAATFRWSKTVEGLLSVFEPLGGAAAAGAGGSHGAAAHH